MAITQWGEVVSIKARREEKEGSRGWQDSIIIGAFWGIGNKTQIHDTTKTKVDWS